MVSRVNETPILHDDAILRPARAAAFLGVGKTTLYRLVREEPDFPRQVRFGKAVVGWRVRDLSAWVRSKAEQAAVD